MTKIGQAGSEPGLDFWCISPKDFFLSRALPLAKSYAWCSQATLIPRRFGPATWKSFRPVNEVRYKRYLGCLCCFLKTPCFRRSADISNLFLQNTLTLILKLPSKAFDKPNLKVWTLSAAPKSLQRDFRDGARLLKLYRKNTRNPIKHKTHKTTKTQSYMYILYIYNLHLPS